jgi:hypothetical protein
MNRQTKEIESKSFDLNKIVYEYLPTIEGTGGVVTGLLTSILKPGSPEQITTLIATGLLLIGCVSNNILRIKEEKSLLNK